jgi:hypothetical protein
MESAGERRPIVGIVGELNVILAGSVIAIANRIFHQRKLL